jgi:hypothetical protein
MENTTIKKNTHSPPYIWLLDKLTLLIHTFDNMKLAIASLLVGSAAAFAPAATPIRSSALNMATETATEKVRYKICKSIERIFGFRWCIHMSTKNATSILGETTVHFTLVTSYATISVCVASHLELFQMQ